MTAVRIGLLRRVDAHRAVADEDDRPQVALFELVRAKHLDARRHHLLARELALHERQLAAVEEALDVLLQAEDVALAVGALVGANALEDADAVVERVREEVDVSGVLVDELAVEPDLFELFDHRVHRA